MSREVIRLKLCFRKGSLVAEFRDGVETWRYGDTEISLEGVFDMVFSLTS